MTAPTELDRREALMAQIRGYWADRGHSVRVWSEYARPTHFSDNVRLGNFEIRSNLVNGLPREEARLFAEKAE